MNFITKNILSFIIMNSKNFDQEYILKFINNLKNDNFNINELQTILKNINQDTSNEKLNNNHINHVKIKRENFFLEVPEIPQLSKDKIKNNKKIKIKNNIKKETNKTIIIDDDFINRLSNKFILKYPKYLDYYNQICNFFIEYFIKKYPKK